MKKIFTCLILTFFMNSLLLMAIPAYPYPIQVKQPNGDEITIQLYGDEFFSYTTSSNNSIIIQDSEGYYTYAKLEGGKLQPSKLRISSSSAKSAKGGTLTSSDPAFIELARKAAQTNKERIGYMPQKNITKTTKAPSATDRVLVIMVAFSDVGFAITQPVQSFNSMLNDAGYNTNGATGSAKDFFTSNSSGVYQPNFDVVGPITLSKPRAYYGGDVDANNKDVNVREMVSEACTLADPLIDYTLYDANGDGRVDNVFVVYAGHNQAEGGGTETVWPHAWGITPITLDGMSVSRYSCTSELRSSTGATMAGIGTFCHEYGHVLGLPDFYDTDYAVNGQGKHLASWSPMSGGSYLNSGKTPCNFTSIERDILGWLSFTSLTPSTSSTGITVNPLSASNSAKILESGRDGEFFILETRKKEGWDSFLPGEGMLVYHVDKTTDSEILYNNNTYSASQLWGMGAINAVASHQCVDIIRAGQSVLDAQDPFPGALNVTSLSDNTAPDATLWNGKRVGWTMSNIAKQADGSVTFNFALTEPSLTTNMVTSIMQDQAQLNGTLENETLGNIVEYGFCWNTTGNPTISDNKIIVSVKNGTSFNATASGLTAETKYYIAAYMKTSGGAYIYGGTTFFKTAINSYPLPFDKNWETTNGWSILDNNSDGNTWWFSGSDRSIAYFNGNTAVANDWLITPPIDMSAAAGKVNVEFSYVAFNTEALDIKVSSTTKDISAFTNIATIDRIDYFGYIIGYNFEIPSQYWTRNVYIAITNRSINNTQSQIRTFKVSDTGVTSIDVQTSLKPTILVDGKQIVFVNLAQSALAEVYNIEGRKIASCYINQGDIININTPGIYIVKTKDITGEQHIEKVIIK